MSTIVLLPVVIDRNRVRGSGTGAMIAEEFGEDVRSSLDAALTEVARSKGFDPTRSYLDKATGALLRMYERTPDESIQDIELPTGTIVRMGRPAALAMLQRCRLTQVH